LSPKRKIKHQTSKIKDQRSNIKRSQPSAAPTENRDGGIKAKKAPPGISPGGAFAFSRRAHPRKPSLEIPSFAATQRPSRTLVPMFVVMEGGVQ
jgi:hypothetical protein